MFLHERCGGVNRTSVHTFRLADPENLGVSV